MQISSKSIWDICVIQKCPEHIKPNTESKLFNAELYLHIFMIHNLLIFILLSKIIHLYRRIHLFFLTLEIRKNTTQKHFQRTKSQIFRVSTVNLFWLKRSSIQDFIIHILHYSHTCFWCGNILQELHCKEKYRVNISGLSYCHINISGCHINIQI